jgi:flagellar motor switch protein FliM
MSDTKPLLTPEEIAALHDSAVDAADAKPAGYNVDPSVRKHDLASEDSSLGVNVAALDMINERFMRLFRLGMLESLRVNPRMSPLRAQIIKFGDYLRDLNPPLSVNVVRMAPLRGYSMVVIEPTVVFSSLDSFFGGFGRGVGQLPPGRLFTPTETRIIKIILQVFFRSMQEAWGPVTSVEFEHVSSEINPQFAQIADEQEFVVLTRFESDTAVKNGGFIDIVTPYVALKPVRDLLRSRVQSGDGNDESDKLWRVQLEDAVNDAELQMQVLLGKTTVSLQQLRTMQPGDILPFKKPDHARVLIADVPAFEVEVGAFGGQTAVKIVNAISPNVLGAPEA